MTRTKSSRALLSVVLAVLMAAAFMPSLTYSSFAATAKKATKVTKASHADKSSFTRTVGTAWTLKYKLSPSKLTSSAKKVVWKSSNSKVAKITTIKSGKAVVSFKSAGSATVTVYTKANKKAKTSWKFKVVNKTTKNTTELKSVSITAPNTSNDPAKLVTPETVLKANVDPATTDVTYQWYADGTPIAGATDQTFKVTGAQTGKAITVKASSKNDVTSAATAKISEMTLESHDNGGVVITNTSRKTTGTVHPTDRISAYVGDTLKATSYATYKDGTADRTQETTDVTYQWYRVAQNASGDSMAAKDAIAGATSAEYKVTDADANYKLIVVATPNSTLKGSPVFSNSAFVSAVTAGTLSVKAENGKVVATVKDAKGNDISDNYNYQWAQGINGNSFTAINSATSKEYANAKLGFYYQVTVTPKTDKYTVDKTTASLQYNGVNTLTGTITKLNDGSSRLFVSGVSGTYGTNYTVTWYKTNSTSNTNPVLATNLGTSQYYTVTAADKGSYIFAVIKSTGSDAAEGITKSVAADVTAQTAYTLTYKDGKLTLDGTTAFKLYRYDTQNAQINMSATATQVGNAEAASFDVTAAAAQGYTYFAVDKNNKVISNGLSFTDNAGTNTSVTVPTFLLSNSNLTK